MPQNILKDELQKHLSFPVVVVVVVGGRLSGRGCDSSYPQIEYTDATSLKEYFSLFIKIKIDVLLHKKI